MFTQCKQICLSLNSLNNIEGIRMFFTLSNVLRDDEVSPVKLAIDSSLQGQPLNKNVTLRVFDDLLPWSKLLFLRVLLTGELMSGLSHWKSWTTLVKAQEMHLTSAGGLTNEESFSPSGSFCSSVLLTCAKDSFNFFDTSVSNSSNTSTEKSLNSCRSNWCDNVLELKNLNPQRRFDRFPLPFMLLKYVRILSTHNRMALQVFSQIQFDPQNDGLESMRNTICRQMSRGASSIIIFTGIQTFACSMETDNENSVDKWRQLRNLLQLLIINATGVEKRVNRKFRAIRSHDLVVAERVHRLPKRWPSSS